MKRIVMNLFVAAALLAIATVSYAPASQLKGQTAQSQCCGDPDPVCPPFCSGGGAR